MATQAGDTLDSTATRKRDLRADLRRHRARLPVALRRRAARAAASHVLRDLRLRRARHVAIYLAHGSELDTAPLLQALRRRGTTIYVPHVDARGRMCFVGLRPDRPMRRGACGPLQPAAARPRRPARRLDLVILPLLGYDRSGGRLGQGGGHYDRVFSGRHLRRPLLLGYAYACQELPAVPREPWDVRLDMLANERGLLKFQPGSLLHREQRHPPHPP